MATKIVVTGHKGYIGSEVFFYLQVRGFHPIGIDLKDGNDILDGIPKNDVTIHCAATFTGRDIIRYNASLLEKIKESTNRIVFTSSAAVYGNTHGATVDSPLNPINDYGKSKVACEYFIQANFKRWHIFRLANVFSNNAPHGVISHFQKGKRVIYGDGKQVRDFVHLNDVVHNIVFGAFDLGENKIVNVSSGKGTTILKVYSRFFDKKPIFRKAKKEIRCSILL